MIVGRAVSGGSTAFFLAMNLDFNGSVPVAENDDLQHGISPHPVPEVVLGDALVGNAAELGGTRSLLANKQARGKPTVLLSGVKTSLNVTGNGRGGRNVDYFPLFYQHLEGACGTYALAAYRDGIDGIVDPAGAITRPDTPSRALHWDSMRKTISVAMMLTLSLKSSVIRPLVASL